MGLLIVDDVHRHYGGQEVLRGATFQIDPEEKVGLVGRNGGGKSTLLRLIEGLEAPDRGAITLRKGARMGHVPQSPIFTAGESVRAYVSEGMAEARAAAAEAEALTERMAHASGADLERLIHEHEHVSERARRLGAWEIERRVETVLSGIGLDAALWDREARTLSGGERGRVALARELVAGHDLLLLDEPTNHLDLAGIEWLEAWLTTLASAVLIVSHDRRLLDRAVGSILDLERGVVRRYPGNYAKYVALREERFQSEFRAWRNQQDFIAKETDFIRRHMAGQRTAEAKGRQKKLENLERLEEPTHEVRRPNIPAPRTARGGELVLEARELAAGYGAHEVFRGLDLRIGRGQRVGIVGPNGAGKSTLLRVLAGRAEPSRGTVEWGHKASVGYYDQDTSDLDASSTPYVEIRRLEPGWGDGQIRGHLARFLFRGDEIEKPVSALSGGERARLSLAKLLLREVTWLAMDEPTNHLDLAARTALEELLGAFDGALVCVSHDRAFLDGLCTRILCVEGGRVATYEGGYSDYRAARLAEEAARTAERSALEKPRAPEAKPEPRKEAPSGGKVRNPWAFEKLEARIMELEDELAALHAALESEEIYRDPERMRETQTTIAEAERELADCNERWANWS
ncbi:MAG TPA: ABC-F family ATP-binding cassette domain-containing protein [Planctomycetota bacterium]|nr:ABC-F family ATP-binding cassette domain-containing protein [Planctomycetota bacterium]